MPPSRRIGVFLAVAMLSLAGNQIAWASTGASNYAPATQLGFAQGDDWEPAVAVDSPWVYVFWMHFGTPPADCSLSAISHMVFQSSGDGGKTWSAPRSIACQAGYQADAQLAVTRVGASHRVYASWMDSNQANSPIFVAFSDDFGSTWSTPVAATKLDHGGSGGDKDILVASGRQVWVTWEHLTQNTVAFTPDIETQPFTPANVPNPAGSVALASGGGVDSHGNLYFVWDGVLKQGIAKGPTVLFIGRSSDQGATWHTAAIDTSTPEPMISGASYDFFGASVALAIIPRPSQPTDRLVAVYNKGLTAGAAQQIYTQYSDDGGQTWHALRQLSSPIAPGGTMHGFPAAIADASGVRVTWMDNRVNPVCTSASLAGGCGIWHVWNRTSRDGLVWTPEVQLDQPAGFGFPYGDYQSLALDGAGNTYAVWGEGPDENGPGNIFFTRN